jgi:tetratricopeptide (TPR) repeat protein
MTLAHEFMLSSDRGELQAAIEIGNTEVVSSLLSRKHGASLASEPFEDGQIPLFTAIELLGRRCAPSLETIVATISLLLQNRADANVELSPLNESPLQIALRVDALGCSQSTHALHHGACMRVVMSLFEHKANPNHEDMVGEGPLAEAAIAGNLEACTLILSHGSSPTAPNSQGRLLLDLDIPPAARALLESFENPKSKDSADAEDLAGLLSTSNSVDPSDCDVELIEIGDTSNNALHTHADLEFRAKRYLGAKRGYAQALAEDPDNASLWSNKAAACMMLGEYHEALTNALEGVTKEFRHGIAYERCAKCMLLLGKLEQALEFCKLRVEYMPLEEFKNPSDDWRAFLDTATRVSHHADVISQIDEVLEDPRNVDCLDDVEKCLSALLKLMSQLSELETKSPWGMRLHLTTVKASIHRGLILMHQELYESARASFDDAGRLMPDYPGLAKLQVRAKKWAAEPPKRNFYAVLRIGFDATEAVIKKAYKDAALTWHPDKNPASTEVASNIFKDIQEAFRVLSDARLRAEYDNLGESIEDEGQGSKGDTASDLPASDCKAKYMPFFGANFGTIAGLGYDRCTSLGTPTAEASSPANLQGQLHGDTVADASAGSRFADWSYKK